MKEKDWVNIQTPIVTEQNINTSSLEAEIIRTTDKAIQIEWEIRAHGERQICRAWLPKSIIILMDTEVIENEDGIVDYHYIALPEWAKVDITTRSD